MRSGVMLFRIIAGLIFLQIALGGLLTFGFISAAIHVVFGLIVFAAAVAALVMTMVSKPAFRPIQIISTIIVVLLVVQIILGFITLGSGNEVIAWVHLLNAIAVYGLAISASFTALRWDQVARTQLGNAPAKYTGQEKVKD